MNCTIRFEDHGQDFLEWDIEDGVVVGCRPFQGDTWWGQKVLTRKLKVGGWVKLRVAWRAIPLIIKYPVAAIGPLKPAVGPAPATIQIRTRWYGDSVIASHKRVKTSSTSSEQYAVEGTAKKVLKLPADKIHLSCDPASSVGSRGCWLAWPKGS